MAKEASKVAEGLPTNNTTLRKLSNKKRVKPFKSKVRETKKMRRLFRKRVRDYNSENSDDDIDEQEEEEDDKGRSFGVVGSDHDDVLEEDDAFEMEEDGEEMEHGVTKFAKGCRAFKLAFSTIMKSKTSETDPLGPVLSAHKKLVAEKLAEEMEDQKVKGEARKEKRVVGEKGHVLPSNYLDPKDKFLISIATKGVVKLFNAVNKAQNPTRNSNASKMKDGKELAKRRKEAFLSELRKPSIPKEAEDGTEEEPRWAPLRDDYMLTSSRLQDWDKMGEEPASTGAAREMTSSESSSDEE